MCINHNYNKTLTCNVVSVYATANWHTGYYTNRTEFTVHIYAVHVVQGYTC